MRPKLAHIIPNFQNPAGYTLSLAKRRALLELAAEHDFMVFEDDPYVDLRFSGEGLPTMLSLDPERVVYASSFSKTVCPGIRVGYLVGPPDLIAAIARLATNTYISPNMVSQSIVYEFCASGAMERSIETVRTALAKRVRTLEVALRRELPEAEFVAPEGGYFMWVTLPEGTDVAALHKAAAELGVAFVKGTDFLMEGGENTLRLAYSGVTPEQIDEGVARLAEAYRSLRPVAEASVAALTSGRSAGPAPSCSGSAVRGGGEGSATTETVSATLGVSAQRRPSAVSTTTSRRRGRRACPESGLQAGVLEVAQQILSLVLEAQDAHRGADLDVGERHAGYAGTGDDRVAVRAGLGVADRGEHALLEHRRHRVLQTLGLLVHLIPGDPSTSVRKRSIRRWRRTMLSACSAPSSVNAIVRLWPRVM